MELKSWKVLCVPKVNVTWIYEFIHISLTERFRCNQKSLLTSCQQHSKPSESLLSAWTWGVVTFLGRCMSRYLEGWHRLKRVFHLGSKLPHRFPPEADWKLLWVQSSAVPSVATWGWFQKWINPHRLILHRGPHTLHFDLKWTRKNCSFCEVPVIPWKEQVL